MTTGPHIPQERKLVTAIPGQKYQELIKRRSEAVSAALGMAIPVVVEKAGGGVIIDVDGNSIIDMGAGIAVVKVGNSAYLVIEKVIDLCFKDKKRTKKDLRLILLNGVGKPFIYKTSDKELISLGVKEIIK